MITNQLVEVSEIEVPNWAELLHQRHPSRWWRVLCFQTQVQAEGVDLNDLLKWLGLFADGSCKLPEYPRQQGAARFVHLPHQFQSGVNGVACSPAKSLGDTLDEAAPARVPSQNKTGKRAKMVP